MFKKSTILAASILLLAGCQSIDNKAAISSSMNPSSALEILAQKSQDAVLAQQSLKTAQAENLREIKIKQANFTTTVIKVDYIGSPDVLLNSVANRFGYRFLENGYARTLPIVNFSNRQETGFELVKDIAVFLNGEANITVDNQNKTILLTYISK
ncbi:hypothetical protein A7M79_07165 [Acinetobacter baumannii]|uniref:DotD/TraH family lipoprotein n=1 Tax=Acinetobacter baumannii TaxID=470 RepID=UPI0008DD38DA|nr:DotD/TraH family lipoprotein [Acinetobacter baumannii]OIH08586.1 hypothetical protein A7M79_07165 [Acinetobacter baumannii]